MSERPPSDPAALYDQAPCALLLTAPTGEIIHANHTFFEWLGVPAEDVLGRTRFQSLLGVGSRIYYETHYAPLLQMQGFVSEVALEIRRADGRLCSVVASARQFRDEHGVALANHVALFDSRDRRRYERELLEARKRAEHAARALESADRQKNDFIATLAHELRNPLAPIRMAVELLRGVEGADPVVTKARGVLHRQVEQMVRLVDDLLDITRLAQHKLTLRTRAVDLAAVVRDAIEANDPLIEKARLRLEWRVPEEPVYAEVDTTRLIQVISNVLHNATKFTAPGGLVSLALERSGDAAVIRIRDTGVGIEPAKLSHVFELFAQAEASAERQGGLGIGLTLAKSLIERHGGQISAHSEGLGHGAEFTIRLPALQDVPESIPPARAPFAAGETVPRRVLVVDDNHDSAELMALLLGFHGHDVRRAYDGLEAVRVFEAFHPEIVLLDLGLPHLDGHEVAQWIRSAGGRQPTLIALTGWGQESDRQRSEQSGFDAHLVKPVDHDELTRLIARLPSGSAST